MDGGRKELGGCRKQEADQSGSSAGCEDSGKRRGKTGHSGSRSHGKEFGPYAEGRVGGKPLK